MIVGLLMHPDLRVVAIEDDATGAPWVYDKERSRSVLPDENAALAWLNARRADGFERVTQFGFADEGRRATRERATREMDGLCREFARLCTMWPHEREAVLANSDILPSMIAFAERCGSLSGEVHLFDSPMPPSKYDFLRGW